MAEFAPLDVAVLLRIGDGKPTEVATFPVPLRAVLEQDTSIKALPQLYVRVDHDVLMEGLRRALREAADSIPAAWHQEAGLKAERDAILKRWEETR